MCSCVHIHCQVVIFFSSINHLGYSDSKYTEMGVGGTFEYLSDLMGSGHHYHHHNNKTKKKKQLQTVELKVRMDCDGCELKVKKALSSLNGKLHFPCI